MTETTIPLAMTSCQIVVPRDCSDVADLLRLPRTETPRMIIVTPRVMKPEEGQKRGQLLAMYRRNMPISVMMSATVLLGQACKKEREGTYGLSSRL